MAIAAVLLLQLGQAALAVGFCADPLHVYTAAGPLVGCRLPWRSRSIDEFLGVPYAAPPVGELRWRPPQPHSSWVEPRPATTLPPACPQHRDPGFGNVSVWSEDCLYLNVWAPSNRTGLPVLVWLYGGGWQNGAARQPLYNGRNLTSVNDVVLVVVNWRVNVFGFFGLQALADEEGRLSGQSTTGFYGQQDQRAAMVWTQRNIERFGGDPKKVALWGQSAGASSVCYHMLLPRSKGLFSRAIVDSSCDEVSLSAKARPIPAAANFAAQFGCEPKNVSCLRGIPAADLNDALNQQNTPPLHAQTWFYPLWDPSEWPPGAESMMGQWTTGKFTNPVPVLIGSTLEEAGWEFCGSDCQAEWPKPFNVSVPAPDYTRVFAAALDGCPTTALAKLQQLYALGSWKVETLVNSMAMMLTDSSNGMGACNGMNKDAAVLASFGVPSFHWVLAHRPSAQPWYVGACHGSEQAFTFGNPRWMWYLDRAFTAEEELLSATMQAAWVEFADTGDPGWARYKPGNATMVFDVHSAATSINSSSAVMQNYNRDRCNFWSTQKCIPSWQIIEGRVRSAMGLGPASPPPVPAPAPAKSPHENWIQGWNSWDALGTAINESSFLAHCRYMADNLLEFGYDHCMIDAGWSAQGPSPDNFLVDAYGRPLPNPRLFPSAGVNGSLGFGPLAKKVHAMGLKFGFHDWRGVLPTAVRARTPVLGAPGYTAADIVMAEAEPAVPGYNSDPCRNNNFSRGINMSHPAAEAFYNSLVQVWSEWNTDVVKVDCNRLKWEGAREEVFALATAFEKTATLTGREIAYILSPGGNAVCGGGCGVCASGTADRSIPCNPSSRCNASTLWRTSFFRMDHGLDGGWVNGTWVIPSGNREATTGTFIAPPAVPTPYNQFCNVYALYTCYMEQVGAHARTGDVHDRWSQDIINMFPVCAAWATRAFVAGRSNDGPSISLPHGLYHRRARPYIDMLPVGEMSSNQPRGNKMSTEQQRVAFTLWSVFGSPLVLGTSLIRMSEETLALVTNKEVIAIAREGAAQRREMWWEGVACAANGQGKHAGVPCSATTVWEVVMPSRYAVPEHAATYQAVPSHPDTAIEDSTIRYYACFNLVNIGKSETRTLRVELPAAWTHRKAPAAASGKSLGSPAFERFDVWDVWRQKPAENYTVATGPTGGAYLMVPVRANSTVLLRLSIANS